MLGGVFIHYTCIPMEIFCSRRKEQDKNQFCRKSREGNVMHLKERVNKEIDGLLKSTKIYRAMQFWQSLQSKMVQCLKCQSVPKNWPTYFCSTKKPKLASRSYNLSLIGLVLGIVGVNCFTS